MQYKVPNFLCSPQNTTNYQNAVTMIGGTDTPAVDLFWTKKN